MALELIDKHKKQATWMINRFCNFRCPYCTVPEEQRANPALLGNKNIEPAVDFFNKTGEWYINLSGGEPFLHPKFIELCQRLTEKHFLLMNSNLSSPKVYEFADKIDPKRVVNIVASLQLTELEKFNLKNSFIEKIKYLKKKGFQVGCTLVMWPPFFNKIEEIYSEFEKHGIRVYPNSFYGTYEGKKYPESYTDEQYEIMKKFSGGIKGKRDPNVHKERVSFLGQNCYSGHTHVVISFNGDIQRCLSDYTHLGNMYKGDMNLFKKPEKCAQKNCLCVWEGHKFAEKEKSLNERLDKLTERAKKLKNAI